MSERSIDSGRVLYDTSDVLVFVMRVVNDFVFVLKTQLQSSRIASSDVRNCHPARCADGYKMGRSRWSRRSMS
jgi:hypothetical protein